MSEEPPKKGPRRTVMGVAVSPDGNGSDAQNPQPAAASPVPGTPLQASTLPGSGGNPGYPVLPVGQHMGSGFQPTPQAPVPQAPVPQAPVLQAPAPHASAPHASAPQGWAGQVPPAASLPGGGPIPRQPTPMHSDQPFVLISLRRAFRQKIDPSEVLPAERNELNAAGVAGPIFQAFLAWRRSLLFMVGVLLIPVIVFHGIDLAGTDDNLPDIFKTIQGLQIAVEVVFLIAVWVLLKSWTNWPSQRKTLLRFWLLYFAAPFAFQLYPYRSAFEEGALQQGQGLLVGIVFSVASMLTLAPKAFALLPGVLRASFICKLLFPGSSAPGWLVTMLGPVYAVLIYVLMVMPLQISGSGLFIASMVGLIGAQLFLSAQGLKLARPETHEEAERLIGRVRGTYLALNLVGILFAMIALIELFEQLDVSWTNAVSLLLGLFANVLLLTLIATDLLISNLRKADEVARDPGTQGQRDEFSRDIREFVQEPSQSSPSGYQG